MSNIFPEPEKNQPAPPPAESAGMPEDLPTTPPPYPAPPAEPAETLGSVAAEPPMDTTPLASEPAPASEWLSEESASMPASTPEPEPAPSPEPVPTPATPQETQALPPRSQTVYPNAPLSESDEHTWSTLAHLSVILTGFVGAVVSLLIYLANKDRSRFVGFQSLQAFLFHIITWVAPGILVALAWALSFAVPPISLIFLPFAILLTGLLCLIPIASIIYGVYAAVEVSQGKDFRYWLLGDWVRRTFPKA
jgi:uncharacterized Tic20 family protein